MIFPGISTIRQKNNRHPNTGLIPAAFATLLLVAGLGGQQANALVIGNHNENHHGQKSSEGLDFSKLKPLGEFKKEHHERDDFRTLNIVKRAAYYDKVTMLCVCDASRSYPVIASIPEEQRAGYCVQICGAPLEGVSSGTNMDSTSTAPVETSAPVEPTSTSAPVETTTSVPAPTEDNEQEGEVEQSSTGPTGPVAPTAPTAPTPPTAPTAPTAPTSPTAPTGPSTGDQTGGDNTNTNTNNSNNTGSDSGNQNNSNNSNDSNKGDDNTALKIGVGVAVGVIVTALIGVCMFLFFRKRKQRRREEEGITFGCVGDQSNVHPALRSEKYIYSAPGNDSKHTVHSKRSQHRASPPSPQSIPPAYSAPPGGVIPSSTNTSSTSLDTNPPILPLGAPSRVLDLSNGSRSFVPGNLSNRSISPTPSASAAPAAPTTPAGSSKSAVQPPSITFFLHPVKNDQELEEEERKWLDDEQKRIREKKEAVEELNKLRAEEDKIREKIRERMNRR